MSIPSLHPSSTETNMAPWQLLLIWPDHRHGNSFRPKRYFHSESEDFCGGEGCNLPERINCCRDVQRLGLCHNSARLLVLLCRAWTASLANSLYHRQGFATHPRLLKNHGQMDGGRKIVFKGRPSDDRNWGMPSNSKERTSSKFFCAKASQRENKLENSLRKETCREAEIDKPSWRRHLACQKATQNINETGTRK